MLGGTKLHPPPWPLSSLPWIQAQDGPQRTNPTRRGEARKDAGRPPPTIRNVSGRRKTKKPPKWVLGITEDNSGLLRPQREGKAKGQQNSGSCSSHRCCADLNGERTGGVRTVHGDTGSSVPGDSGAQSYLDGLGKGHPEQWSHPLLVLPGRAEVLRR